MDTYRLTRLALAGFNSTSIVISAGGSDLLTRGAMQQPRMRSKIVIFGGVCQWVHVDCTY